MAGKKGQKKHANKSSYPNQKGNKKSPAVIMRILQEIRSIAEFDKTITSWQGACLKSGFRVGKMDYWANKIPVFGALKKEVQQILIARLDYLALTGTFNVTASIWRQKQLGERDTQYQESNVVTEDKRDKEITVNFINAKKKK